MFSHCILQGPNPAKPSPQEARKSPSKKISLTFPPPPKRTSAQSHQQQQPQQQQPTKLMFKPGDWRPAHSLPISSDPLSNCSSNQPAPTHLFDRPAEDLSDQHASVYNGTPCKYLGEKEAKPIMDHHMGQQEIIPSNNSSDNHRISSDHISSKDKLSEYNTSHNSIIDEHLLELLALNEKHSFDTETQGMQSDRQAIQDINALRDLLQLNLPPNIEKELSDCVPSTANPGIEASNEKSLNTKSKLPASPARRVSTAIQPFLQESPHPSIPPPIQYFPPPYVQAMLDASTGQTNTSESSPFISNINNANLESVKSKPKVMSPQSARKGSLQSPKKSLVCHQKSFNPNSCNSRALVDDSQSFSTITKKTRQSTSNSALNSRETNNSDQQNSVMKLSTSRSMSQISNETHCQSTIRNTTKTDINKGTNLVDDHKIGINDRLLDSNKTFILPNSEGSKVNKSVDHRNPQPCQINDNKCAEEPVNPLTSISNQLQPTLPDQSCKPATKTSRPSSPLVQISAKTLELALQAGATVPSTLKPIQNPSANLRRKKYIIADSYNVNNSDLITKEDSLNNNKNNSVKKYLRKARSVETHVSNKPNNHVRKLSSDLNKTHANLLRKIRQNNRKQDTYGFESKPEPKQAFGSSSRKPPVKPKKIVRRSYTCSSDNNNNNMSVRTATARSNNNRSANCFSRRVIYLFYTS